VGALTGHVAGATAMAKRLVESTTHRILGVSGVSEVLIPPLARRNEGSLFIHMGVSWPGENPQNPETPEGTTTHIPPRCNRRSSASS
jgi:hypothetical protein